VAASLAFVIAIFKEARIQIISAGINNTILSFAVLSVFLLPRISRQPGTQRIRTALEKICRNRGREGYLRAISQNSLKTNYEKPEKNTRNLITISRLSRNTYIFITSLAIGARRIVFVPLSIADTSASKTSVLRPKENNLR
jgi:hypothetical protein